jgi:hypothetical protein
MKVKTWIKRRVESDWIEDEKIKNILINNNVYRFWTHKEQILDIDLNDIIDDCKAGVVHEAGYRYCNRLYDLVHKKSIFIGEKDDLEYEIIEKNYPYDIPFAHCEFDDVEEFHKWMLENGRDEEDEELY